MNKKNLNGFTLPEVIIVTTIAITVGSLLLAILVNNMGIFYRQSSRVHQGLGLNDSLLSINTYLKEAKAVASGYPEDSTPVYTSTPTSLVLKLSSIDSSNNVISGAFDYAIYYQNTDKLYLRFIPSVTSARRSKDQILTDSVDSIYFQYFDSADNSTSPASAVKVRLTVSLKQRIGVNFEANMATTEAMLRNN